MITAYLNQTDNSSGLPAEIISYIKNNVTDDVAMYIESWKKDGDIFLVQVERVEYYEAMLPDSGQSSTYHELKFNKFFKII